MTKFLNVIERNIDINKSYSFIGRTILTWI